MKATSVLIVKASIAILFYNKTIWQVLLLSERFPTQFATTNKQITKLLHDIVLSCPFYADCKHSLSPLWEKAEKGSLQTATTSAVAEATVKNRESHKRKAVNEQSSLKTKVARDRWKKAISKSLEESEIEVDKRGSAFALQNPSNRQVWRPKQQPRLADLVASLSSQKKQKQVRSTSPPLSPAASKISLQSRQQMLQSRVQDRVHTTKAFFEEEILEKEKSIVSTAPNKPLSMFKKASRRVLADVQRTKRHSQGTMDLADVAFLYLAKMRAEYQNDAESQATNGIPAHQDSHMEIRKRISAQLANVSSRRKAEEAPRTIPLERWCKIVRENRVNTRRERTFLETEV